MIFMSKLNKPVKHATAISIFKYRCRCSSCTKLKNKLIEDYCKEIFNMKGLSNDQIHLTSTIEGWSG